MQELNINSPDFIQVRCPECFKGYNVAASDLNTEKPKFACVACQTQFFISKSEALNAKEMITGKIYSQALVEPAQETLAQEPEVQQPALQQEELLNSEIYTCPKCSSSYSPGQAECKKCGVVFFKFKENEVDAEKARREHMFSASKEVRYLWEDVLADYENIEAHQNFVSAAWADKCLEYAALKYGSILEVMPQDEMARKLVKEVQELTKVKFEMVASEDMDASVAKIEKFSFFDGVQTTFKKFKWINLILVACGFIIGMGLLLPHMRNLIGFGSSILFFVLALRYYFRVI
ncbi:MAG: hypothetical protein KDD38_01430 [Bdellovibrionales bacterium]|nr:hypothetical protein [Bdellovibrionales bacterium]